MIINTCYVSNTKKITFNKFQNALVNWGFFVQTPTVLEVDFFFYFYSNVSQVRLTMFWLSDTDIYFKCCIICLFLEKLLDLESMENSKGNLKKLPVIIVRYYVKYATDVVLEMTRNVYTIFRIARSNPSVSYDWF